MRLGAHTLSIVTLLGTPLALSGCKGCSEGGGGDTAVDELLEQRSSGIADTGATLDTAGVDTGPEEAGTGSDGTVTLEDEAWEALEALDDPLSDDEWEALFPSAAPVPTSSSWTFMDRRECLWEATVAVHFRDTADPTPASSFDDGTYAYATRAAGASHVSTVQAPKAEAGMNCLSGPWDQTEEASGLQSIDYRLVWRLVEGDPERCSLDCDCTATAEAIYYSKIVAFTELGFWCPNTRIANAYAADAAEATLNATSLLSETAGAQSGDSVETTIEVGLSGEYSSEDGASASASIGKSETRVKDEGTSQDSIHAVKRASDDQCRGYAALTSGSKAFARQDARAFAAAQAWTRSAALSLTLSTDSCGGVVLGASTRGGYDQALRDAQIESLIRPFFEAQGIDGFPD